ncbi:MAG: sulfite exporter TauE/SafE family protein [Comamonas sp.]|nr:sulfite exporter TauE/SafE family protein [Comamonas sp.]
MLHEAWLVATAVAVFGLAGWVKGMVGLGLPTVSMALLALFMPPAQAAALLLLPSLVTNVVQMRPINTLPLLLRRLGGMQLGIVAGTLGGMAIWGSVGSLPGARMALGLALVAYGLWGLCGPQWLVPQRHQVWLGWLVGFVTGGITALTGVFVVPAVAFLQSLGLARQALMQAMGLCFTVSTVALGLGMWWFGKEGAVSGGLGLSLVVSGLMLIPALVGMHWGEVLREGLSPARFKKVLMGSLMVLGVYMLF